MTDAVQVALIMAIPATLTGTASIIMSIRHTRKLQEIHVQWNSRLDQLMATTELAAHSIGHAEGVQEERERRDAT